MRTVINKTEQELGLHTKDVFKLFLAHLYTEAIAGLLIDEFTDSKGHDPQEAVEYLSVVLKFPCQVFFWVLR